MSALTDLLNQTPEQHREGLLRLMEARVELNRHYGIVTPEGEVPVTLTLEQMKASEIEAARALRDKIVREHAGKRDLDDWSPIWHLHDRVLSNRDLPDFAIATVVADCWTEEEERDLIQCAWTLPEWPDQGRREQWLFAFTKVGFMCTVEDCPLHANEFDQEGTGEPLRVYRGSLSAFKRGLSWTLDRERAEWFVRRGDMSGKGRTMHLWVVDLPPERVEAHFGNRSENEIVADVRGLKIREDKP